MYVYMYMHVYIYLCVHDCTFASINVALYNSEHQLSLNKLFMNVYVCVASGLHVVVCSVKFVVADLEKGGKN